MFSKKDKKEKKDKKDKKEKKDIAVPSKPKETKNLLIFDGDETHDWPAMFKDCVLPDGSAIRVIQASWIEVEVSDYGTGGCFASVAPVKDSTGIKRPQVTSFTPHFLLLRNQPRGPTPDSDRRNVLYGLMHAGIPAINSLESEYMNLERPLMFGALKSIQKEHGDKFPLIKQTYYSSHRQMVMFDEYPAIAKISHAHRGMGKIRIESSDQFRDLATVIGLHHDYASVEKFIEADYGIRVQKIGSSYRVFKKIFTGSGWKSQFGGADLQVTELTDTYKFWADECAKLFGGMDLLAVDAIHGKDGKDYIIELNATAIGLHAKYWEEDSKVIRDMVLERMGELYSPKSETTEGNNNASDK